MLEELDRELTDVYPAAKDLLYYFLDASKALTAEALDKVLAEAAIAPDQREKVVDFLLYYGVLGVQVGEHEYFIYSVNYDLKVLKIRAERGKEETRYIVIPRSGPPSEWLPKQTGLTVFRHSGKRPPWTADGGSGRAEEHRAFALRNVSGRQRSIADGLSSPLR